MMSALDFPAVNAWSDVSVGGFTVFSRSMTMRCRALLAYRSSTVMEAVPGGLTGGCGDWLWPNEVKEMRFISI